MTKRLFVGNLPYSITSQDLNEIFTRIGEVREIKLVTDAESGKSKGFAFVEMASAELGQKAIDQLNGKDLGGRSMSVTEAKPRPEGQPKPSHRFGGPREGGFKRNR